MYNLKVFEFLHLHNIHFIFVQPSFTPTFPGTSKTVSKLLRLLLHSILKFAHKGSSFAWKSWTLRKLMHTTENDKSMIQTFTYFYYTNCEYYVQVKLLFYSGCLHHIVLTPKIWSIPFRVFHARRSYAKATCGYKMIPFKQAQQKGEW